MTDQSPLQIVYPEGGASAQGLLSPDIIELRQLSEEPMSPIQVRIENVFDGHLMQFQTVWGPYSAKYLLQQLLQAGLADKIKGKTVIDMGCGIGILGISAAMMGAKFVLFVDNHAPAVANADLNAQLLGLKKGENYDVLQSDVFSNFKEGFKADIIIANVPMNPYMPGIHEDDPAKRSNQNGDPGGDGNQVLLTIIENAKST